jgi:hypothetical protein
MTSKVERAEDRLADFTRDKRILILSLMAVVIGALSAVVARILAWLIAVITNLVFFQRFSSDFVSSVSREAVTDIDTRRSIPRFQRNLSVSTE